MDGKKYTRRELLRLAATTGAALSGAAALGKWGRGLAWAASRDPIRIGAIGSLTGVVSVWGKALRQGATLAVEEINAAGGILGRPVNLHLEDDESNAEVGVRKARKLVQQDQVDMLVGVNHSGVLLNITDQLPDLKRLLIATCATSAEATTQRFNKYVFRIHSNSDIEGASGALYAARFKEFKRWSVIAPDYSYGYETWGSFISNLKQLRPDIQILDIQAWPPFGSPDYTSHITRLRAARPDAVLCAMWGGDAINVIRQLSRFRFFEQTAFFTPAALSIDVLYALGEEVPEGLHTCAHAYWFEAPEPGKEARNKQFVQRFFQRWQEYPHPTAHDTYAAVYAYKEAVERAKSTETDKVIQALEGATVETPGFTKYIRPEDHQAIFDILWGQTVKANDLPFKRRISNFVLTKAEETATPVSEVLRLRKSGERAPYFQYVRK